MYDIGYNEGERNDDEWKGPRRERGELSKGKAKKVRSVIGEY